jgi:sec-independent protein translocase protein TatB
MLGLGWTEMLVIGVVALIVIGPKDLPVVMGRIGKIVGQIRRMGNDFQREINRTTGLDEVRNLRNSITSPLKKTAEEIRKEFNTMTPTGPQPSGAIKPASPGSESVVDELRSAAGIPAVKKSNDELAADYGFKGSETKAVKAADPAAANPVATSSVVSADLPAVPAAVEDVKKPARKRAQPKKPAADASAPAVAKGPAKKRAAAKVVDGEKVEKPAKAVKTTKKTTTARKKPSETAEAK